MKYTIRPISDRTPFTGRHQSSPFRAKWVDTLDLLSNELAELKATNVVLEVDCTESAIRLDGMLYANAKVTSPAVRIAFESKHGPLTYATDRYVGRYYGDPPDWQHNVRAIAKALEALRLVDRYGITKRGEQYAGWKALPAGAGTEASHMTADQALALLREQAPPTKRDDTDVSRLYRWAHAGAHPDRHAGDRTLWDQVEQAAKVLGVLR